MRFRAALLAGLLFGVSAFAADKDQAAIQAACRSAGDVDPEIDSCTDNHLALEAAQSCRSALLTAWRNADGELSSVMALARQKLDPKQQADFFRSHSDLQLAIQKLQSLVDLTAQSADKLADYPDIMYDNVYAEENLVGSSSCYKNNFLAIGKIVDDLDQKVTQGLDALAATNQLRGISQARDDGMRSDGRAPAMARGASGVGAARSTDGASDVTGLAQDEAKQAALGAMAPTPTLPRSPAPRGGASAITAAPAGDDFRLPGVRTKLDPTGIFSRRGTLERSAAQAAISPRPANSLDDGAESVGSVLWRDSDGSMEIGMEANHKGAGEASGLAGEIAATDMGGASSNDRSPASTDAGSLESLQIVAAADTDLFVLVSRRYHATDLFSRARASDVPLNGFDPKTQR